MTSRRKFKRERELVADIHKTFERFCNKQKCIECDYRRSDNCEIDYIVDLLEKEKGEI